jgi:uncharacterized protein (TIGR02145 family)
VTPHPNVFASAVLYTWASAAQACTRLGTGWRLPTDDEWRQLAKAYGGLLGDSEGRAASTDLLAGRPSGFNAVLGGNREAGGNYARLDEHGFYWTATESDMSMHGSTTSAAAAGSIATEVVTSRWPCQCGALKAGRYRQFHAPLRLFRVPNFGLQPPAAGAILSRRG